MESIEAWSRQMLKIKYMQRVAQRTVGLFFWWWTPELSMANGQLFRVNSSRFTSSRPRMRIFFFFFLKIVNKNQNKPSWGNWHKFSYICGMLLLFTTVQAWRWPFIIGHTTGCWIDWLEMVEWNQSLIVSRPQWAQNVLWHFVLELVPL